MFTKVAQFLDPGGRKEQQDAVFSRSSKDHEVGFYVLCDGAGGHSAGGEASRAVVKLAAKMWEQIQSDPDEEKDSVSGELFLKCFFEDANEAVREVGKAHNDDARAVAVALFRWDSYLYWGHVGDSRMYLYGGRERLHRTIDHSVAQALVDSGMITEGELASHPDCSRIHRALGADKDVKPNFGKMEDRPDFFRYAILCSDGFWGPLEKNEWIPQFRQNENPRLYLKRESLRALELAGDKADNLSAILVQLGREKSEFNIIAWMFLTVCLLSGMLFGLLWALVQGRF